MIRNKVAKLLTFLLITLLLGISTLSCNLRKGMEIDLSKKDEETSKIKIGLSMGSLIIERWQRDRDIFVAKAKELGAEVIVQNANSDSDEQISQIKYLMDQNVDVLVIVPHDANKLSPIINTAKREKIKVISYDRLVRNANVDIYISFDNVKVGKMMAQYLVHKVPSGNYVIINGAKIDYNSYMFNQGYKNVLEPYIKKGDINIISEIWAEDWRREYAFNLMNEVLERGEKIDAIIAANDTLAETVIEALAERRLAGKVPVVGHDAELAACQRVVEGTQLMTVYKPIDRIAQIAAQMAVALAKGEQVTANSSINDGKYEVPYYMLQPIAVTKENMIETVIKDGFHRLEDVYRNVPKEQWPVE